MARLATGDRLADYPPATTFVDFSRVKVPYKVPTVGLFLWAFTGGMTWEADGVDNIVDSIGGAPLSLGGDLRFHTIGLRGSIVFATSHRFFTHRVGRGVIRVTFFSFMVNRGLKVICGRLNYLHHKVGGGPRTTKRNFIPWTRLFSFFHVQIMGHCGVTHMFVFWFGQDSLYESFTKVRGGRVVNIYHFFRVVHYWGDHRSLSFLRLKGNLPGGTPHLQIGPHNKFIRGWGLQLIGGHTNGICPSPLTT